MGLPVNVAAMAERDGYDDENAIVDAVQHTVSHLS